MGHFHFFAYESKLSTLQNKNAPPASLERHATPTIQFTNHFLPDLKRLAALARH